MLASARFYSALYGEDSSVLEPALSPNPQNISSGGGGVTVLQEGLLVAEGGPVNEGGEILERLSGNNVSIYVVREGDSLSEIAEMFGVSTDTVIWNNNLKGQTINPGQTLTILPVSGVKHTVVSGDTLSSIAKKYGGKVDTIEDFNTIPKDGLLAVGAEVIVPGGKITTSKTSSSQVKTVAGASNINVSGYFIHPLPGSIVTQGVHGYNGMDFGARSNSSIVAAASGEVITSSQGGWNGGYGNTIVIAHDNGTQTLYAHLSRNIVTNGQRVVKGQVIGYVGSTGRSTGPHLHFEVRGAKSPFSSCAAGSRCGS